MDSDLLERNDWQEENECWQY